MTTITINPNITNRLKAFGGTPELLMNLFADAKLKADREPSEDSELTQERLKELLSYDPETGEFRWKAKSSPKSNRVRVRDVAGALAGMGHRQITIDGTRYYAHRLVFLYMTGELPKAGMDVDHINGIKDDNRWDNLRIVTKSVNQQNQRKSRKDSSTGIRNVYKHGNGFMVEFKKGGKYVFRKYCGTLAEASRVSIEQKRIHHPESFVCTI